MKAVVFDMDGVLFDTESVCFSAWDAVSKKMNVSPPSELAQKTLGMNEAAVDGILKEHYGADFDTDKFRTLCREYTSAYFAANGVPQKPGLHEALKSLKNGGYKIAIASSTSRRGVYRNLNDADIANMFDCVICGDMVEKSKPEPDIYIAAARQLGVDPAECFAVEDSKNGILSACCAGMKVIMIPDLWHGGETDTLLFAKCDNLLSAADIMLKNLYL